MSSPIPNAQWSGLQIFVGELKLLSPPMREFRSWSAESIRLNKTIYILYITQEEIRECSTVTSLTNKEDASYGDSSKQDNDE
jgi:hypothetical protein